VLERRTVLVRMPKGKRNYRLTVPNSLFLTNEKRCITNVVEL